MTDSCQPDLQPRLLMLIPHLGGGGAEQVIAMLARGLNTQKYEIHLALITQNGQAPEIISARIPASVTVHPLGAHRVRSAAYPVLRLIRRIRPQLILSGMFHLNFLILLLRPLFNFPVRILIRQNGTASSALKEIPSYNRFLYRMLYPRADCVLCQSASMVRDLHNSFAIPESRLSVLPNPIDSAAICSTNPAPATVWPNSGPHLLAVGRLSREKGFDILLKSFSIIRRQFPSADLLIAGTGSEESSLRALCSTLSLDSAVRFLGHVQSPAAYFPTASLFVLSSRHEGLPNALLEAAAAGMPIVSTPASDGLVELIREQPGVWLVSATIVEALAHTLTRALDALAPGQRFQHGFMAPYRLDSAISAWEALFDRFLASRPTNSDSGKPRPVRP